MLSKYYWEICQVVAVLATLVILGTLAYLSDDAKLVVFGAVMLSSILIIDKVGRKWWGNTWKRTFLSFLMLIVIMKATDILLVAL